MSNFALVLFLIFSRTEAKALTPSYSKAEACVAAQKNFEHQFSQLEKKYLNLDQLTVLNLNKPLFATRFYRQSRRNGPPRKIP